MKKDSDYFYCKSCHNGWSLDEGFRVDTMQCYACQKWDDDKPKREKEYQERQKFLKQYPNGINFPYVAGDPFW
jgi:hypothetical protein